MKRGTPTVLLLQLTQLAALRLAAKPRLGVAVPAAAVPAAAHAASVSYDFGYRLERSLDPDKRGPASDDSAGSDLLAAMCNPPAPEMAAAAPSANDAAAAGLVGSTALAAKPAMATAGSAKPAAAAAAAMAAVAVAPIDPASSAEPALSLVDSALDSTHSTLLLLAASDTSWIGPTRAVLGAVLSLFTVLFLLRVVLSWFPKYDLNVLPWNIAAWPTEPILKPTRLFIPPVAGVDVSPLVWVAILSFVSEVITGPQGLLSIMQKQGAM